MNDMTQVLDLSVTELEDMVGMSGCSQAGNDPRACDASLGGAVSLAVAFSAIAIAVT